MLILCILPNTNEHDEFICCCCCFFIFNLERKLQKLRKDTNVTDQLKAHREHCVESLLRGDLTLNTSVNEDLNRLEEEFEESHRRNITRYLNPEQALNTSELVHIINHDQLDAKREQVEESHEDCTSQQ